MCQSLRKPSLLKYSNYIDECAQELGQAAQSESDILLHYLIQLQRLGEEVEQAFNYSSEASHPYMDAIRIDILVKSFEQRLSQCEAALPVQIRDNGKLKVLIRSLVSNAA